MDIDSIPKVELHCHLDGIIDPAMLRAFERDGVTLALSAAELERLYPVDSFERFIAWARAHDRIEGNLRTFHPVLAAHIERLIAQNVVYAEITIGSSEIPRDAGAAVDALNALREVATRHERGRTQVEFLVGVSRSRTAEHVDDVASRAIALRRAGQVVGFVIAGLEQGNPVRPFARTLARLRDAGVGIEVHAGEWAGGESVRDALEHGRPHRIGHGVAAFGEPALLERMAADGVHVEMCPTSNVRTGAVSGIEAHPLRQARELGVRFSVNTDDPGAFGCSMSSEFRLLREQFGFSEDDFRRIARDALAARFQPALRGPAAALAG